MPPHPPRLVRPPSEPPAERLTAAVCRAAAAWPEVSAAYLFEQFDGQFDLQPEGHRNWSLYAGIALVPGAEATVVMPAIDRALHAELPAGSAPRVVALSRRMLATVRRAVSPLWPGGPVGES